MKEIQLNKGMVAIVDDSDYKWLSLFKWRAHNPTPKYKSNFYALNGKAGFSMHRVIMCPTKGMMVDHKNGNSLDNRRENLRICTQTENKRNRKPLLTKRSGSKYLGVDLNRPRNKWISRISLNSKKIHLGTFDSEIDAAIAYNEAAKKYFGEFANLNVV